MGADADQVLTVSEAAALLGITERSVRRRMAKLPADSVRRPSGGSPALLSMAAVESMRPEGHSRSQEPRTDTRTESGGSPAESGDCPAPAADIVEELRAEVARMEAEKVTRLEAEVARLEGLLTEESRARSEESAWLRDRLEAAEVARAEERRLYLAVVQALPAGPTVATYNDINATTGTEPQDAAEPPQTGNRGRRWWQWPRKGRTR